MRFLITILLFLTTINLSGQITAEDRWASSIKNEFNLIKETGTDTLLVYYEDLGPWTNLPDSCKSIQSAWIIWSKWNEYYVEKITCDQTISATSVRVSSAPIEFFSSQIKDLLNRNIDSEKELTFSADGVTEYLFFMTSKHHICLNISDYQRGNKNWRSINWINVAIQAIDITKYEINKNNVR